MSQLKGACQADKNELQVNEPEATHEMSEPDEISLIIAGGGLGASKKAPRTAEQEYEFNLAAEPRGGREYRASRDDSYVYTSAQHRLDQNMYENHGV